MKKQRRNLLLIIAVMSLLVGFQRSNIYILSYTPTYTLPHIDEHGSGDIVSWKDGDFDTDYFYELPSIDIDTLSYNDSLSHLELSFYGTPILDPNHTYRILISWNEYIDEDFGGILPNLFWDFPSLTKVNITLCVAGGASWFGVTNGSYNSFFNMKNESIFLEEKSDSVTIINQSLIFPINTSFITNYESPARIIVFTIFDNSTENSSIVWLDASLYRFFNNFFMIVTPLYSSIDFYFVSILFAIVGVGYILIITRKRRK